MPHRGRATREEPVTTKTKATAQGTRRLRPVAQGADVALARAIRALATVDALCDLEDDDDLDDQADEDSFDDDDDFAAAPSAR
jgi:hypothetical protein